MRFDFVRIVAAISLMIVFFNAWADLTTEQKASKDRGLILYNMSLGKQVNNQAASLIEVAAEAGDPESQSDRNQRL